MQKWSVVSIRYVQEKSGFCARLLFVKTFVRFPLSENRTYLSKISDEILYGRCQCMNIAQKHSKSSKSLI